MQPKAAKRESKIPLKKGPNAARRNSRIGQTIAAMLNWPESPPDTTSAAAGPARRSRLRLVGHEQEHRGEQGDAHQQRHDSSCRSMPSATDHHNVSHHTILRSLFPPSPTREYSHLAPCDAAFRMTWHDLRAAVGGSQGGSPTDANVTTIERTDPSPSRSRRRRPLLLLVVLLLAAATAFGLFYGARAADAALEGKASLLRAESLLRQRKVSDARAELVRAQQSFTRSSQAAHTLTRYLPGIKAVPLVGSQVKGVEVFADAGVQLSDAGVRLADAAGAIVEPQNQDLELSDALGQLREVQELLRSGITSLDAAVANVESLDGDHLIRPLGRARTDLSRRLPEMKTRAVDADEALASLITFAGGDGPRRYLVLSQNPDEVRPTGGFIGTYGVLEADGGHLSLDTYDSIESWIERAPRCSRRADGAGLSAAVRHSHSTVIWPTSTPARTGPKNAALAAKLWHRAGEQPVQGVVSFSPAFLGRILRVLGPVRIESYDETVTADNLVERLDFHTHQVAPRAGNRAQGIRRRPCPGGHDQAVQRSGIDVGAAGPGLRRGIRHARSNGLVDRR